MGRRIKRCSAVESSCGASQAKSCQSFGNRYSVRSKSAGGGARSGSFVAGNGSKSPLVAFGGEEYEHTRINDMDRKLGLGRAPHCRECSYARRGPQPGWTVRFG